MRYLIGILAVFVAPAYAHDFDYLEISKFSRIGEGPYLEILINNTVKGKQIICAVFDADNNLVASDTQLTSAMVTKVLIHYPDNASDASNSAKCAFN